MSERRLMSGETLVMATHNAGKLIEMRALLQPHGITATSCAELNLEEPEETGMMFSHNAALKAHAAAKGSGLPALADDSGLCVEALDGAPGIFSARWAGPQKDFKTAMQKLEHELSLRNGASRKAYFMTALVIAWPDGLERLFEGRAHGTLTFPPRGDHGFGYDPVFMPQGCDKTFAEMKLEEKQALSHRAKAFTAFAEKCLPLAVIPAKAGIQL